MDPRYFLDEMEMWEVESVLEAYTETYKTGWEQTRYLAYVQLKAAGSKVETPEKLMRFSWEAKPIKKTPVERMSPERKAEMLKLAKG